MTGGGGWRTEDAPEATPWCCGRGRIYIPAIPCPTCEKQAVATEAFLRRQRQEALGYREPVTEARCTHCKQTKPRDDFPPSKIKSTGISSWCRVCHRAATAEWKARKRAGV